jgi:hypothetical protein
MKKLNDWKKEQFVDSLSLTEWYKANKDKPLKSFTDWKIYGLLQQLLEQGPDMGMPPGMSPMPGQADAGAQPQPPAQNDPANIDPIGETPTQNMDGEDENEVMDSLKQVIGEKSQDNDFPVAAALKLEAKKAKERTIQKKMDSGAGLKMWLWTCLNAWFGTKVALPKPEEPPQQQQPPPQLPQPGQPEMSEPGMQPQQMPPMGMGSPGF